MAKTLNNTGKINKQVTIGNSKKSPSPTPKATKPAVPPFSKSITPPAKSSSTPSAKSTKPAVPPFSKAITPPAKTASSTKTSSTSKPSSTASKVGKVLSYTPAGMAIKGATKVVKAVGNAARGGMTIQEENKKLAQTMQNLGNADKAAKSTKK